MYNPVSTYRIQFHKDFTFADLASILPYLAKLGVGTVYASPVFTSVAGSTHGYDGTDPSMLDPEIGSEDELVALRSFLNAAGMGWLQDIVPNHQAFDLSNPWLADLLEKGPEKSRYADYFDVDWSHPSYTGKIMLPFLGEPLEKLYEKNEIKITLKDERYFLQAGEQLYPIDPETTKDLSINSLDEINNDPKRIQEIEKAQHYQLSYWENSDRDLNFRRFFTVNGLLSLNIQYEKVFEEFHAKTLEYTRQGLFDGLRIDHIDGLYDPGKYLEKLRAEIGPDKYLVVEKILQTDEILPDWPVEGSTGYDFLAQVNSLFTYRKNKSVFKKRYAKFIGENDDPYELRLEKKRAILHKHMAGDLDNLFRLFSSIDPGYIATLSVREQWQIKAVIAEILVEWPVYRHYPDSAADSDLQQELTRIFDKTEKAHPDLKKIILQLRDMFLVRGLGLDDEYNTKLLGFLRRLMQFTGPLTAKGVEDTLMYTYHPLLGHNEVGDDVEAFGIDAGEYHELMMEKLESFPHSMNATSTHDTKRGEDARARLNVLSEMPERWFEEIKKWRSINEQTIIDYHIHPNDEYFIYQVLIGAYPFPGESENGFLQRIQDYLIKALREGKLRSSWNNPNAEYEKNVQDFLGSILNKEGLFFDAFHEFLTGIVDFGIVNSLAQLTVKLTSPGVPDIYQGTEFWDLTLVDPDNRRPVDYEARASALSQLETAFAENPVSTCEDLWEKRYQGNIKLLLTHLLLQERRSSPELFAIGKYIPLKVKGKYSDHLFAFARVSGNEWAVTVVPLFSAVLNNEDPNRITRFDWKNTRVILPVTAPAMMKSFTDIKWGVHDGTLPAADLFENFPVGYVRLQAASTERSAGVLLSVTSLPSKFGTGDLGPAAYEFADQLADSRQHYWQVLPLNPVSGLSGFAPYSSYSAMAGNTLLISPELLMKEHLLEASDLEGKSFEPSAEADFTRAETFRKPLFEKAFSRFQSFPQSPLHDEYAQFLEKESWWLKDHSLFLALKNHNNQEPWPDWKEEYKDRDENALSEFSVEHSEEIEKENFLQFIFQHQFSQLKSYCKNLGISLIGDLPFYTGHDSTDVWANREIFDLDEEGQPLGIAGVPPDYFNSNGQLWGMPVFRWERHKESGYTWWLNRIARNLELVDLLRLDHFRAFAGFWRVTAGEITAINGRWLPGPADDFFKTLKEKFPTLPFIAEDLGEITPDVYKLRDDFNLPGMRVLQFAFGKNLGISVDAPHNYIPNSIVYTGTHDNNTSRGWFRKDSSSLDRKNLSEYAGFAVKEKSVHETLATAAYASVAKTAILPMQDIIGLDETARMNTPSVAEAQWLWRMLPGQFTTKHMSQLAKWVRIYNRG